MQMFAQFIGYPACSNQQKQNEHAYPRGEGGDYFRIPSGNTGIGVMLPPSITENVIFRRTAVSCNKTVISFHVSIACDNVLLLQLHILMVLTRIVESKYPEEAAVLEQNMSRLCKTYVFR